MMHGHSNVKNKQKLLFNQTTNLSPCHKISRATATLNNEFIFYFTVSLISSHFVIINTTIDFELKGPAILSSSLLAFASLGNGEICKLNLNIFRSK